MLAKLNETFHVVLLENSASWIGWIDEDHCAGLVVDCIFQTIVVNSPVLKAIKSRLIGNKYPVRIEIVVFAFDSLTFSKYGIKWKTRPEIIL